MIPSATIFVKFLATLVPCQQYHDATQLINQLTDFYRFDHHIYLMDASTDLYRWFPSSHCMGTKVNDIMPQTVLTFDEGSLTENALALKAISSKNTFLVVVVEGLPTQNGLRLLARVNAIRTLDYNVKIGVFVVRSVASISIMEQLFHWSWNASIVRIFSAFYLSVENNDHSPTFNVFTYDPFGTFALINVTGSESLGACFPDKIPNYRQYPIRFLDIREFDRYLTEIKVLDTIVSALNASMSKISVSYAEYAVDSKVIGDIMHREKTANSYHVELYPYRQTMLVMVVPHSLPYSDFFAYLRNAPGSWASLFVYTGAVIIASSVLLIISGYLHRKKILIFQCVLDVFNLVLNNNEDIKYRRLHGADIFVTVPLTFTGLIVMNGVVSVFKSYLMSPIYEPQINSFDALYRSKIPILVHDAGWIDETVELLEDISKQQGWINRMRGIKPRDILMEMFTFNNSVAIPLFYRQATTLLDAQKRLGLKVYYLMSKTIMTRYMLTYRPRPDFPFIEAINTIIHRFHDGGLVGKWQDEDYANMTAAIVRLRQLKVRNESSIRVNESDMAEFTVPAVIWWGWIASAIVFIGELMWTKIKSWHGTPTLKGTW